MNQKRIHITLLILSLFSIAGCKTQQPAIEYTSTTPAVTTKSTLKVIFDDSKSQLIGIDKAGSILDSAVVSFQLSTRVQGVSCSEKTEGCFLSSAMLELLKKTDVNSIIYFEHIQAKDAAGLLGEAPSFQYNVGYSYKPKK